MTTAKNKHTVIYLVAIVFFMSGFSFALVPLYDIFCEVTGLNGKTGDGPATVSAVKVDKDRLVTVQFIANMDKSDWQFKPTVYEMKVHPGEMQETSFFARNLHQDGRMARAVPSVSPGQAAQYLRKTECFCFTQQAFKANEGRDMPLRFMVDPELPEKLTTLTLSYTFYEIDEKKVAANN